MTDCCITITGTYKRTLFKDHKNGYTVFAFRTKDITGSYYQDISCEGYMTDYVQGMPLVLECIEKSKGRYKIVRVSEKITSEQAAIEYLSGGICKGIGTETAKSIIKHLGKDIFTYAEDECLADKLCEVKGVTNEKAEQLAQSIKATVCQRQIYEYISRYGYSYDAARNIFEIYGLYGLNQLKSCPYTIGIKCGLSFSVCDNIAFSENIAYDAPDRLRFIITQALFIASGRGHVYLSLNEIFEWIKVVLKESSYKEYAVKEMYALQMLEMKNIVLESSESGEVRVYLRNMHEAEKTACDNYMRITSNSKKLQNHLYFDEFEKEHGILYDNNQKQVFHVLDKTGIKIITGGPGTGKTTTIKGLIYNYMKNNPGNSISLCAPTGRAAQRMEEAIGMGLKAYTIHKLLGLKAYSDEVKNEGNPLEDDLIIVDECSMIDIQLFATLLKAIKTDATVILVGDINQLPSVGPGIVLNDLIKTEVIELYRLCKIHRQENEAAIVYNSLKISEGSSDIKTDDSFSLIRCEDAEEINVKAVELFKNLSDENFSNVELLTPMKKENNGSKKLNEMIQKEIFDEIIRIDNMILMSGDKIEIHYNDINLVGTIEGMSEESLIVKEENGIISDNVRLKVGPQFFPYISLNEKKHGIFAYNQTIFRKQDKIIMTENNYDLGYMNGDMGTIKRVLDNGIVVEIDGEEIEITGKNLEHVQLAYAITIHKSQGSEYPIVIIALPKCNMLKRNLLFTAVTRAKEKEIILSEQDAYETAINNNDEEKRNSFLCQRLKGIRSFAIH